ncbi:hypothetical protein [Devosia naphthalenivorans]|uniref:hypothetical protein n=1 Tax=Devosia naphthalenivorans TaxID=2082392 RepID=UPI000D3CBAFD|nr:hypothetical protein [Devosia naphthalenivorans]
MNGEDNSTLWTFVSLAASAGILSALVTGAIGWSISFFDRRAKASYLALRLSIALERFAASVVQALFADQNAKSSGGQIGDDLLYVPPIEEYPEAEEVWPTLNLHLANRALTFRLMIQQSNRGIRETYEILGEEGQDLALKDASRLAHEAVILSRDLRHSYSLAQSELSGDLLQVCADMRCRYKDA